MESQAYTSYGCYEFAANSAFHIEDTHDNDNFQPYLCFDVFNIIVLAVVAAARQWPDCATSLLKQRAFDAVEC